MTTTWDDVFATEEKAAARTVGRRPRFEEDEHPRDREGKFVEKGGTVKLRAGGTAEVLDVVGGGRIRVRRDADSREVVVDAGLVTQTESRAERTAAADPTAGLIADTQAGIDTFRQRQAAAAPAVPDARAAQAERVAAAQAALRERVPDLPDEVVAPTPDQPFTDTQMSVAELNGMRIKPGGQDEAHVEALAERYRREGYTDAPVQVEETNRETILTDGHHRLAAAERAGIDTIPARRYANTPEGRRAANAAMAEAERAKEQADAAPQAPNVDGEDDAAERMGLGAPGQTTDVTPSPETTSDGWTEGNGRPTKTTPAGTVHVGHPAPTHTGSGKNRRMTYRSTVEIIPANGKPYSRTETGETREDAAAAGKLAGDRALAFLATEQPEHVRFTTVDELRDYLRAGVPNARRSSAQSVLDEIADDPTLKLVPNSLGGLATRGKGGSSQLIHTRSGTTIPTDQLDRPGRRATVDRFADALIAESINWRVDWGLDGPELFARHGAEVGQAVERAARWVNDEEAGRDTTGPEPEPDPGPEPAPDPTPGPEPDPEPAPPRRGNYFEGAETGRVAEPPKVTVGPPRGRGDRVVTVEYDGQTHTLTTRREFSHVAIASFTQPDGTNGLYLTLTRNPDSALRQIRQQRDGALAAGYRKFTTPWAYPMDTVVRRAEDEIAKPDPAPAPTGGGRYQGGAQHESAPLTGADARDPMLTDPDSPEFEQRHGDNVKHFKAGGKRFRLLHDELSTYVSVEQPNGRYKVVGYLRTYSTGETSGTYVDGAVRRLGLGTQMRDFARERGALVRHSRAISAEGAALANADPDDPDHPNEEARAAVTAAGLDPDRALVQRYGNGFRMWLAPESVQPGDTLTTRTSGGRVYIGALDGTEPEAREVESVDRTGSRPTVRFTDGTTASLGTKPIIAQPEFTPNPTPDPEPTGGAHVPYPIGHIAGARFDGADWAGVQVSGDDVTVVDAAAAVAGLDARIAELTEQGRGRVGAAYRPIREELTRYREIRGRVVRYGRAQGIEINTATPVPDPTPDPAPAPDPGPIAGGDVVGRHSEQGETTPTAAPNLRPGQVIVRLSGNGSPPRYFEVTRAWARADGSIRWRERTPGAVEETIPAQSTQLYNVADNPPPQLPERDEAPEVLQRWNPPTEDTGPTILADRLAAGDRIRQGGEVFTVVQVADADTADHVQLTIEHAGVRSVELVGRDAVLDWADDASLPAPERHARDINARRPAFYTYQRRKLVALGLDLDDDPLVAAAAQRVRLRQGLSVEEATALAARLRTIAEGEPRQPQARAYGRIADLLDAAAVESGSVTASGRFDVAARPVRGTVADLTEGDQVAFVDQAGRTVSGRLVGTRTTMGGRLVEAYIRDADGAEAWHLLTRGTVAWRLPDLPEPAHIPQPPKRRKLREHITADRVNQGDRVTVMHEGREVTGEVYYPGIDADGSVYLSMWPDRKRGPQDITVRIPPGDGGPQVIRHSRGYTSDDQSWDAVLPDERRRKVAIDKVGVGDRVEWTPLDGSAAKMVTVIRATDTYVEDPDNPGQRVRSGRTLFVRDDFGDTEGMLLPGDVEMTVVAAAADDARAAMERELAERAERARTRDVSNAIEGAYLSITQGLAGAIGRVGAVGASELLEHVDLWEQDPGPREVTDKHAQRIVARLRGMPGAFAAADAADPDVQAIAGMLHAERARIAGNFRDSIREMDQFPDEDAKIAQARTVRQWLNRPPSQARNVEAMARALLAGHDLTSRLTPSSRAVTRPASAEGELADRMATYRAALPDDLTQIGQSTIRRATYVNLDPAELERGLMPSIGLATATGIDTDRDGGPGRTAMAHLDTVKAAGRELTDEWERRIASDPRVQQTQLLKDAYDAAVAEENRILARIKEARDAAEQKLAERYGFANWAEVVAAKERGSVQDRGRNGDPRWDDAFDAHMARRLAVDLDPDVDHWTRQKTQARETSSAAYKAFHAHNKANGEAVRRDAALALLAEVRPMGGKTLSYVDPAGGRPLGEDDPLVKGMRYAERFMPDDWIEHMDRAKDGKPWKLAKIDRGNHNWSGQQINLSWGSEQVEGAGNFGRVAIHELGHGMEQAVPGLKAMQRAFLWSRTSTGEIGDRQREDKRDLGGSMASELSYFDEFPERYTGKDYGTVGTEGEAYEVFTTGIESMFAGSGYLDDDFRAWTFGVLALLGEPQNRAAQVAEERRAARRTKPADVPKDTSGVPWRLDYEFLSKLDDDKLDELSDYLAEGLAEADPREGQRWDDFETYMAVRQGQDELVEGLAGRVSDEEVTAAVEEFARENGRPGLTHPRVGGKPPRGRGISRADVQDEYATFVEVQYLDAEAATRGHMLNDKGIRDGISPRQLFSGDIRQVYRYASPELLEYWETTRRVGWSEYYYERTKSPGSARAAQRQAEQNARINRDRTDRPTSSTRRPRR